MLHKQRLDLKPQAKLVTRLFLSPKIQQNLHILTLNSYDLIKEVNYFAESNPFVTVKYPKNESQNLDWISNKQETLRDHLISQVNLAEWRNKDKAIVKDLIDNLAQDGYLRVPLDEIQKRNHFSILDLKKGIEKLQSLDPLGVGARNLTECLLIQAKNKRDFNPIALSILKQNKLKDLADFSKSLLLNFSAQDLRDALQAIRTLNPIPSSGFASEDFTQYLIPDLKFLIRNNEVYISEADLFSPELIFDETEYQTIKEQAGKTDLKYLSERKSNYNELKRALTERRRTLYRIAKFLGSRQKQFLLSLNKRDLKPLGLKEIAQNLGLSVSTISRGIKGKHFEIRGKVFSLNILLAKKAKKGISQNYILFSLRNLISQEDKNDPLSDQQISNLFNKKGIKISRRAVTKYRKKLSIPNSYHRK